ncbi:MAG: DUF2490 domain-containing protein [Acidobacteriota bacterium]|nr:DUF2490 domain-containing protein [Acidobacteriota bacterium]
MKHFHFCLVLTFFCCVATTRAQSAGEELRKETQFRTEVEVAMPLYKNFEFVFGGDFRFGQVAEENRFVRGEVGFLYKQKIGKFLTLVPRYRYRATQEFNGASENENRLSFDGVVGFTMNRFNITDNNLFEYRIRSSGNTTRFRNRLKVSHPISIADSEFALFASDEIYYEWEERAWTRNRFKVGVTKDITAQSSYELYYMRQNDGFSRPGDLHVFGIEFEIGLKRLFGR